MLPGTCRLRLHVPGYQGGALQALRLAWLPAGQYLNNRVHGTCARHLPGISKKILAESASVCWTFVIFAA